MLLENKEFYLRRYDAETYLFDEVGPKIRQRGYATFEEFFLIGMWKTVRAKPLYIKNVDIVETTTKEALSQKEEKEILRVLCTLKGVSVPVASAFLTVIYPDKYAVIDIRCLEMLNELGIPIPSDPTIKNYIKYMEIMRSIAEENNVTPRDVDKILFAMHTEKRMKEGFKNVYNYDSKRANSR